MKGSRYTKAELYDLWIHFSDDPNAETMLSEFMQSTHKAARALITEFELRHAADELGLETGHRIHKY